MMNTFIILLSLLMACSSYVEHPVRKYVSMDTLWRNNSSKEEVIKILGKQYREISEGIVYDILNSNTIESAHFFDQDHILVEQFIFLDETLFQDFKKNTQCKWDESEKMVSVGHTVYTVKKGKCTDKNISYEFKAGNNRYEVRWKR